MTNKANIQDSKVHAVFIPETPEMQDDINGYLSTEGVEFVDLKPYPAQPGSNVFPFKFGGVWLLFRGRADLAIDISPNSED